MHHFCFWAHSDNNSDHLPLLWNCVWIGAGCCALRAVFNRKTSVCWSNARLKNESPFHNIVTNRILSVAPRYLHVKVVNSQDKHRSANQRNILKRNATKNTEEEKNTYEMRSLFILILLKLLHIDVYKHIMIVLSTGIHVFWDFPFYYKCCFYLRSIAHKKKKKKHRKCMSNV